MAELYKGTGNYANSYFNQEVSKDGEYSTLKVSRKRNLTHSRPSTVYQNPL